MLMPASSEFVALCRSQVAFLTQGLGASFSVVYLTEELVDGTHTKLIPIVAYPDTAAAWEENPAWAIPQRAIASSSRSDRITLNRPEQQTQVREMGRRLLSAAPAVPGAIPPEESLTDPSADYAEGEERNKLLPHRQIVLPLIHEAVVMGLLVAGREDRPWNEPEVVQIERIAHTIAIACILDQRGLWYQQQLSEQQELQAQQNDLLDNLLHQLRSPLTALRTFGKLLLKRLLPPDPNRDIGSSIVRESDRVQELLQQMDRTLEMTKTGEDSQQPIVYTLSPQLILPASGQESCSVTEVLEPLLVSASAIAGDQQLDLQVEIPSNLPPVRANSKALREVLSNLIDNALKYTPAGGQIYIKVGNGEDNPFPVLNSQLRYLAIAISDTGPGIPAQDLDHLFERHFRGVQESTEIPGTGLGLAIARDLVNQMQGKIEVFSPSQHQWTGSSGPGTTFVVWLPAEI